MLTLKRLFGDPDQPAGGAADLLVGFVFLFAFLIWVTGFDIIRSLGGAGS